MELDELINYAINREILIGQKMKIKDKEQESSIAYVKSMPVTEKRKWRESSCYRCGSWRHSGDSSECYARKARCNSCGRVGHFGRVCKKDGRNSVKNNYQWKRAKNEPTDRREQNQRNEANEKDSLNEIFTTTRLLDNGMVKCMLDTVHVVFLIDSGASVNTVTEQVWLELQKSKANIQDISYNCDKQITTYASNQPLKLILKFKAVISINQSKPTTFAEFIVVQGSNKSLLGKVTAEELKVLKVGLEVQNIEERCQPFPKFPGIQIRLSINKEVPPKKISYVRIPIALEKKVESKIQQMLETDIIEPVDGPPEWISPMVVVPKGKDDIRICINMKYPNQAIQREHFPLPVIETLLNKLQGCKIFSKLDITSAYHHVELHPDSRGITTFMTNKGLMRFKRLMFGINCVPEIFQRIMTQMLLGIAGVVIYIDDIVIAGKDKVEHDSRLKQVLEILGKNNATLNKDKCSIEVKELEILGYNISASGIGPTEAKIEAIKNFRKPITKEVTRSFLGLVNFVGQFIHHLSSRSEPLRKFIRGEIEVFGKEQEAAFDDLRLELSNNVRKLGFFKPEEDTELYVDASPTGLGAVLNQRNKKGMSRIISFASKGLTKPEKVYPQTQREALAVVWAVEKFYPYLFGTTFTIFTDHKTLEYIFEGKHQSGKRACSRAEGWALRLQPYNFVVKYIPGSSNISDSLSRLCPNSDKDKSFDEASEHYVYTIESESEAITLNEIKAETDKDETMREVIKAIENQSWKPKLAHYQAFSKELGIVQGIVVRDDRLVLPEKLRQKALKIAHIGHPGEETMKRKLRERMWWPYMDREITCFVKACAGCAAVRPLGHAEPMIRKEMPDRPWQDIAIDFFSVKEYGTFLVVVDYYSRFIKIIEMKITSASKTIEALETICKDQSYPESIRCDNGPPFSSEEFKNYFKRKDIKIIHTIPYWPQMNGLVERNNRGILRALRIAKAEKNRLARSNYKI
ncbi:uncharacterized protein K02A2.6-like [Anopheles merus]|uniref:uncharacterized protein K02A2.6-like n=1 Tax=Anopheles merus TaxID=30066 RepID=UPI001BE4112D|nr:uncharacterized protein K02A2.6-like [Anopheles merus]XP_041786795.1 uncharacterized protein K02A2.6-like [Anopheles merus]XP_041786796.1 uncharacterized protein K02A2.6-like [Anopheles merus]